MDYSCGVCGAKLTSAVGHDEFRVFELGEEGESAAGEVTRAFDELLGRLAPLCGPPSREFSIVKTKLEEACFFAKKSMAKRAGNSQA